MTKDNSIRAFPRASGPILPGQNGMTLLEYYAGQAIVGLLAQGPHDGHYKEMAKEAWAIAQMILDSKP